MSAGRGGDPPPPSPLPLGVGIPTLAQLTSEPAEQMGEGYARLPLSRTVSVPSGRWVPVRYTRAGSWALSGSHRVLSEAG
jgi:hypothetical protein